ncbi:MAG: DUF1800 domain-containing protein [Saprospiraceae bacterium]|nr:DUF1800 domain-containing protein [Saprospiraceae bacterium]
MGGFTNFSLEPYQGSWNTQQAGHLLRRTMYGPLKHDIDEALKLGFQGTVEKLLQNQDLPDPPINAFFEGDPQVPLGESWVGKPVSRIEEINKLINSRLQSLTAWQMGLAIHEGLSIREKMTLFWYNHFVTADIRDANFRYRNITNYRINFLGNFRELTKITTIDPAMLRYLNGNQNTKNKPNENYARELLELFTIGKGPLAGEGDYTNYTEDDILAVAKVLTGWRDRGYLSRNGENIGSEFRPFQHDKSVKQLSHRFNNEIISDMGDQEYQHLIDIIFIQDEVSRFIARKIYRWFVYYDIDENIELNIIGPMAEILRENDYEMYPMVEALLKSQHFYDEYAIGAIIKNPIDFIAGSVRQLKIDLGEDIFANYRVWVRLAGFSQLLQMTYYNAPSVAGWKAYYQEPLYYRTWINSSTLSSRLFLVGLLLNGVEADRLRIKADLLSVVDEVENANDPNQLIDHLVELYFPKSIADSQKEYLKSILIPGLPDYEWTLEYDQYKTSPDNEELKIAIENRLKGLYYGLLSLPEYQLS